MKPDLLKAIWPLLLKTVFPSALGAFGAILAVVWSDGFRSFCGLQ